MLQTGHTEPPSRGGASSVARPANGPQVTERREFGQRPRIGSNRGVLSRYRFSGPFVVRLLGLALTGLGVLVVGFVTLVALLHPPTVVLATVVVAAVVVVVALGLLAMRRPVVVSFDERGYQVRWVRGAGVRQAEWRQVEDVVATELGGERCVVLRLRDGRTTTVPVGILAGRPDDFVRDLQRHLNSGHGYRTVRRRS
jgi:hypothetical protein